MSTHNADVNTAFGTTSGAFASQTVLTMDFGLLKTEMLAMGTDLDDLMNRAVNFDTRTAAAAATIDSTADVVVTRGYSTAGDGGGGVYVRVGANPSHQGKISSNGGTVFWELVQDPRGANPLQFGADPTGATASDTAFINCWGYARAKVTDTPSGVVMYIPPGDFLLTTGNVFGGTSATFVASRVLIHGAGGSSLLRYVPTSAAKFSDDDTMCALYDGGTVTGTKSTLEIERIKFENFVVLLDGSDATLSSTDTVMGLRNYQNNGFQFHSVDFINAQTYSSSHAKTVVYEVQGTSNGSEMYFNDCEFRNLTTISRNKNPQAVAHFFDNCNVITFKGHAFEVDGGVMPERISGGSWLWDATPDVTTYTGTHDGAGNASSLTDSGASFPTTGNGLVGCKIKNTTDGSEGFITANTATTVTATLAGGTDNDWDASDAYQILGLQCLIEVIDGTGMGSSNHTCTIDSIKPELRADEQSALYRNAAGSSLGKVFLRNTNLNSSAYSGSRSVVTLREQQAFVMQGGVVPDDWHCMVLPPTSQLGADTWTVSGQGLVWIDRAGVSADLSESVTFLSDGSGLSAGRFVVTNSIPVTGSGLSAILPMNFERNAGNVGAYEANFGPFEMTLVPARAAWSGGKAFDVIMPYGCKIDYVHFFLPGAGATATSRDHVLSDADGTIDTYSGAENADLYDTSTLVGTSANKARTTTNARAITLTPDASLTTARRGAIVRVIYSGAL